jgi:hypothetical protein
MTELPFVKFRCVCRLIKDFALGQSLLSSASYFKFGTWYPYLGVVAYANPRRRPNEVSNVAEDAALAHTVKFGNRAQDTTLATNIQTSLDRKLTVEART